MEDDPEMTRRAILTMASRDLLKHGDMRPYDIIEAFTAPFYLPAHLTAKCFELWSILEGE
jgi:hypothetical protein